MSVVSILQYPGPCSTHEFLQASGRIPDRPCRFNHCSYSVVCVGKVIQIAIACFICHFFSLCRVEKRFTFDHVCVPCSYLESPVLVYGLIRRFSMRDWNAVPSARSFHPSLQQLDLGGRFLGRAGHMCVLLLPCCGTTDSEYTILVGGYKGKNG